MLARRATHGLVQSGYRPLKMSRSLADRFGVLRSGADTRWWEKSRIITERISAATKVMERGCLNEPLRKKTLLGYILTPCTFLVLTHDYAAE